MKNIALLIKPTIFAALLGTTLNSSAVFASDGSDPLWQCTNTCNWAAQDTGYGDLMVPCATAGCNYMDADPNLDVNNCKLRCSFTFNQTDKDYTGKTQYDWCAYGCDAYPTK
ncbi:MAG: hypothetical protein GY799_09690 [Desulfobulbaceae bacterium]|nr:hypothetical protein [Desulfobulbaceae bacterium]